MPDAPMQVRVLGCGDAFGSGGRFQTCFLISSQGLRFLVDCGATSVVAMHRYGIDRGGIDFILLTHLHGDHMGGVPFFVLDSHFSVRRTRPLLVAGPPGTRARLREVMEAFFPGSPAMALRFPLEVTEYTLEQPNRIAGLRVTPYEVVHPSGAPPTALRIESDGRSIAYSGDTQWAPGLIRAADGTDLLLLECNGYDKRLPNHLDLGTLLEHKNELRSRRIVLTHMGEEMLTHRDQVPWECAEDGMTLVV
jgi:ribonuclease BN (tRNA processing enzyme)